MSLPLQYRNYQVDLYSQALTSVWAFYDRVTDPSYALAQDVDAWEKLLRDPKASQGVQQRLNDVAGPNWRVFPWNNSKAPKDKLKAAIFEEMLRLIPHFADARKRLAQAIFRGQSIEMILAQRRFRSLADTEPQDWLIPVGLKHVDHRRFTYRPERTTGPDGKTRIRARWYMSMVPPQGAIDDRTLWGRYIEVKHPEHFVKVVYDDEESRLGFGRGIMDALYFYVWTKEIVLREGLQGLERWAQGIPVAKIDAEAHGAASSTQAETLRDNMISAMAKMRGRGVFAIDKRDDLQVLTGGGEGHQIVVGFLHYLDDSIIAVSTGAALRSGGATVGTAGTFASDKVGADTQSNVVQFDRNKVDEDVRTDLMGLLNRLNRPQFAALGQKLGIEGLADAEVPLFRTVNKRTPDPDAAATRIKTLLEIEDFEIRKDEAYEQVDLTPPAPDDEVFRGRSPQQSMVGPFGGAEFGQPGQESPAGPVDEDVSANGFPEDDESLFDGEGSGQPEDRSADASSGGGSSGGSNGTPVPSGETRVQSSSQADLETMGADGPRLDGGSLAGDTKGRSASPNDVTAAPASEDELTLAGGSQEGKAATVLEIDGKKPKRTNP